MGVRSTLRAAVTLTAADAVPETSPLLAVTLQEYATPAVRLYTLIGDPVPVAVRVVWPEAEQFTV